MAIRADSYGSTSEVKAFTRHLLDGQSAFNSTTRPTSTELETFIDRASGALNVALEGVGLRTPVSNTTAKLSCDSWVTAQAVQFVELTQRGAGSSGEENNRFQGFSGLHKLAQTFARENRIGFLRLGVTVDHGRAEGLQFTGQTARADRADPDDSGLEQPLFRRHLFDDPTTTSADDEDDE